MARDSLQQAADRRDEWVDYIQSNQPLLSDVLSTVGFQAEENSGLIEADRVHTIAALQKLDLPDGIIDADLSQIDVLFQAFLQEQAPLIVQRIRDERRASRDTLSSLLRRKSGDTNPPIVQTRRKRF